MQPNTAATQHHASSPSQSSPERALSAATTELVRSAFRAWVLGEAQSAQQRSALRLFCDGARRRHLRPEQMLVALKTTCRSVPEACSLQEEAAGEFCARAVTMCIEEFYAEPDAWQPGVGDVTTA